MFIMNDSIIYVCFKFEAFAVEWKIAFQKIQYTVIFQYCESNPVLSWIVMCWIETFITASDSRDDWKLEKSASYYMHSCSWRAFSAPSVRRRTGRSRFYVEQSFTGETALGWVLLIAPELPNRRRRDRALSLHLTITVRHWTDKDATQAR